MPQNTESTALAMWYHKNVIQLKSTSNEMLEMAYTEIYYLVQNHYLSILIPRQHKVWLVLSCRWNVPEYVASDCKASLVVTDSAAAL